MRGQPDPTLESLKSLFNVLYLVEHDVEAETEGRDEERVPEQKGEEGLEDLDGWMGGSFQFRKMHCFIKGRKKYRRAICQIS